MTPGETTLYHLLAPINNDLLHPGITEIVVQRPGEVGTEIDGKWHWKQVAEFTFARLDAIGLLAGSLLQKPFDPAHPIVESTLPGGQRFTAARPPVTPAGTIAICIRIPFQRIPTVHDQDFKGIMEGALHGTNKAAPEDDELLRLYRDKDWKQFFTLAVHTHKAIGAVGPMASGKTTFLRRIMQALPPDERVLTIQDTDEFGDLPVRNLVSLRYGSADITAAKLVETSLRFRADRLAVQELRGAEAFDYLRIGAAGHRGGLTSWHAETADAFAPLAMMVKSSDRGRAIPDDKLDALLRRLIDIIAFCKRDPISHRFTVPSVYFRLANDARTLPR